MLCGFRSELHVLNCRSPSACTESSSLFVTASSYIWKPFPGFILSPKIKLSWNVILVCTREITVRTLCVWKVLNLTEIVCLADQIFLFKCRTQCAQVVRNMNRVEKTRTLLESKNYAFAVILHFFSEVDNNLPKLFPKAKIFQTYSVSVLVSFQKLNSWKVTSCNICGGFLTKNNKVMYVLRISFNSA